MGPGDNTRAVLASAVDNLGQYSPREMPANTYFIVVAVDAVSILRTFIHGGKGNL